MKQLLRIAAVVPILAFGASAQEEAIAKMKMQLEGSFMGQTVKNAPYSADEVTQSTQVLADGTRIHHENKITVYRDSEGRVRRESPDQVTIIDPVARTSFFLNPKTMTAQKAPVMMNRMFTFAGTEGSPVLGIRTFDVTSSREGATSMVINGNPVDPKLMEEALNKAKQSGASVTFNMDEALAKARQSGENVTFNEPVAGGRVVFEKMAADKMDAEKVAMAAAVGAKFSARGKSEDLGKQNMEGVNAEGTRTTSTIEAGAIGNDRAIQIVSERWYSPELQTVLMTKTSDPRIGENSFSLTNVHRGEPGAYLFQVPAGYTIADRK